MKKLRRRGIHSHLNRTLGLTWQTMANRALFLVDLCARYKVGFIRRHLRCWVRQLIQISMQPHPRESFFKRNRWGRSCYRGASRREVEVNASRDQQHSQQNSQDQTLEHVVYLS